MRRALSIGIAVLALAAAGCSQIPSPPSSQAAPPVRPSFPAPPLPAPPAPRIQSGGELPALFKSILTPIPAAIASVGTPTANSGTGAPGNEPGASVSSASFDTGTKVPPSTEPSATPLATPVSEGIPDVVLRADRVIFGVGQELDVRLVLTSAPTGVSGFVLELAVADPDVAEIVAGTFPSYFGLATASELPASSATLRAVDLSQLVNPTPEKVILVTAGVKALAPGTTEIRVVVTRFDDDNGLPVNPMTQLITLTVQ